MYPVKIVRCMRTGEQVQGLRSFRTSIAVVRTEKPYTQSRVVANEAEEHHVLTFWISKSRVKRNGRFRGLYTCLHMQWLQVEKDAAIFETSFYKSYKHITSN